MPNNKLYYFCETDFIAEKIKETARLLTSNEMQKAPNGRQLRFVSFERSEGAEEPASLAVILDKNKLEERYELYPYLFSSAIEKAKVKYIAAYEDQNFYTNLMTAEKQLTLPVAKEIYDILKQQILDMREEDKQKYNLEVFGKAKAKSRGSLRTEMLKFNVRRGGLSLTPDLAERIAEYAESSLNEEFRIWTDADTIDLSDCILN